MKTTKRLSIHFESSCRAVEDAMNTRTKDVLGRAGVWTSAIALAASLAACGGGGDESAGAAVGVSESRRPAAASALPSTYTVVNLAPDGGGVINSNGQVAYTDDSTSINYFYDGVVSHTIPNLPGATFAIRPQGINASGQVVGCSPLSSGLRAWSWTIAGGIIDLGTLGGSHSCGRAVNDIGNVTGESRDGLGFYNVFLWKPDTGMTNKGRLLGNGIMQPKSINTADQIVGEVSSPGSNTTRAFSVSPTQPLTDLGTLNGNTDARASSVNDSGQVVGQSFGPDSYAFLLTQAGGMVNLGAGNNSAAGKINNLGQVIGVMTDGSYLKGFSWTQAGGLINVGSLVTPGHSLLLWLNSHGQAAGHADVASIFGIHAVIWSRNEGLIDINSRIANPPPGLEVTSTLGIADTGDVLAYSTVGLVLLKAGAIMNAAPSLGPVTANDPVAAGATATVSASFTDTDTADTHSALWSWGDATPAGAGQVTESGGAGTVAASHAYSAAGVYPVSVTVTDNAGKQSTVSGRVVVYDPSAGFVTGGGWIASPAGAYKADTTLAGRANFAFVSKYKKGATTPTGNTEFQFQAAKLNFHSENYDWLVVAGARAQYKGSGTINGTGDYSFMLTAVDGNLLAKGTPDRFRIKIWHYDADAKADVVDYDNQLSSNTDGTVNEGTVIGGGSIVVQKN